MTVDGDLEAMSRVWQATAQRVHGDSNYARFRFVPAGYLERFDVLLPEPLDLTDTVAGGELTIVLTCNGAIIEPGVVTGHYRQRLWLR